jgi:teichuronic acid biosynthesis glycosyltransferase TuaC
MLTNAWPDAQAPARATFMRTTVEGLSAAGLRCDVLYLRGYQGLHVYALGCLVMFLLPWARAGQYRLVHAHAGETTLVARCFHGAPVLASYWGTDILGTPAGPWRSRLKVALSSRVLRRASVLMSATTTKSAEMERVLPRRAQLRNHVIPDGVDRARFRPRPREEARRVLGWPPEGLTVISVGRRNPPGQAAVAGRRGGHDRGRAAACAALAGDLRRASRGDADALLRRGPAAAHGGQRGLPHVIKEALASNLPVVATPVGDIPELLHGVEPSAVCPGRAPELAQAIVSCLRQPRRSNGRQRTDRVALEHVSAQTLVPYRSLGAGPMGTSARA